MTLVKVDEQQRQMHVFRVFCYATYDLRTHGSCINLSKTPLILASLQHAMQQRALRV